ncbi:MAG: ester cyclase [Deltaproteobacteria bacterium]
MIGNHVSYIREGRTGPSQPKQKLKERRDGNRGHDDGSRRDRSQRPPGAPILPGAGSPARWPARELCSAGYVARIGSGPSMDYAGHEGFAQGFYAGFPDATHQIEDVIATPEAVVVRFVLEGTHGGSFFGIPASQRRIRVPAHAILRVREGRVGELLAVFDEAGLLRQIGVLPGG